MVCTNIVRRPGCDSESGQGNGPANGAQGSCMAGGATSGSPRDERGLLTDPARNYTCSRCRQRRAEDWKHYPDGTRAPWCNECTLGASRPPRAFEPLPNRYANRHRRWAWRPAWAVYEPALRGARKPHSTLSPEERRAWQALNLIARQQHPSLRVWRAVLECGTPPILELFTPLHYQPECRWTKRDRRIREAVGLGGALVQFINTREGGRFLRAIQKADTQKEFPFLPPPIEKKDDPTCDARYLESCIFRLKKMRLKRCHHGRGHWFIAPDYRNRRYCPAHRSVKGLTAKRLRFLARFMIDN